ncbi:hypothetical protein ACIQUQ_33065 [Streptomyces sp. NPDC101118]|uniref:hypothetical protein n=1 Tax=Streptomyces sp. NPDC101118 TaxID=3366109 RepID=UPI00382C0C80
MPGPAAHPDPDHQGRRPHVMTEDEARRVLAALGRWRAFGSSVGSDRLIQAGLDALLAGVDCPSIGMLAGLTRQEEPEARELFDQVLDELGLRYQPPQDPTAAKWALAYWIAEQMTDGSLDPAVGAYRILADVAYDLGYPDELQDLVSCADDFDDWDERWSTPTEDLNAEAVTAARELLRNRDRT